MAASPPKQINSTTLDQITRVFSLNPVVSGAVNSLKTKVTQAGVDVIIRSGAEKFFLNRKDAVTKRYINLELVPLIDTIVLHWILYGFVTVRAAPSQFIFDESGNPYPTLVVVPHSQVYHMIYWNQFNQMTVKAFSKFGGSGSTPAEIPFSQVSCIYPPDSQGNPQSPLALSLKRLSYIERLWTYYLTASFKGINPLMVFREDERSSTTGGNNGMETPHASAQIITSGGIGLMGTADVENTSLRRQILRRQRAIDSFKTQITDSMIANKLATMRNNSNDDGPFSYGFDSPREDSVPPEIIAYESAPVVRNTPLFAPPGMALDRSPPVTSPADPIKAMERVNVEFYRALGLLPITMLESSDRSASNNAALIQQTIRDTVTNIQRLASVELSKLLTLIMGPDIVDNLFALTIAAQSNGNIDKANLFGLSDKYGMPLSKSNVGGFDRGYIISTAESGVPYAAVIAPFDAERNLAISSGKIDLEIKFAPNPTITPEEIMKYYEMGIIHEEATQRICARLAGLSDQDLRPDMATWRKQQFELQHPKKPQEKKPASKKPRLT